MDILSLKSFLAVLNLRSFSNAAKELNVTQSAMSKRIMALEKELNTNLFDVIGKVVYPTSSALKLESYAKEMVMLGMNLQDNIAESPEETLVLRIGSTLHINHIFFPDILKLFREHKLPFKVYFKQLPTDDVSYELELGNVDIVFSTKHIMTNRNINGVDLWQEPIFIVTSKTHPLANTKNITPEMLSKYPAVLTTSDYSIRNRLDDTMKERQLPLDIVCETSSFITLKQLVDNDFGWSIFPLSLCDETLVKLDTIHLPKFIQICWYSHESRAKSKLMRSFMKIISEWQLNMAKKYPA